MISSLCWVPRGAAKPVPEAAVPSEAELASLRAEAEQMAASVLERGDDADEEDEEPSSSEQEEEMDKAAEVEHARAVAKSMATGKDPSTSGAAGASGTDAIEAAMAELDMDHYDSDEDDEGAAGGRAGTVARWIGASNDGGKLDPYLAAGAGDSEDDDAEDSEEAEDFVIRPDDLLILAARNEDEVSNLEVWLYEEVEGEVNGYVHHDILLPAFPLALAWMDVDPSGVRERANMVAVASMEPGIEIWDLDVLNAVEPACTLGGYEAPSTSAPAAAAEDDAEDEDMDEAAVKAKRLAKKKAAKKKKAKQRKAKPVLREGSHSDAVLGLSWNREYRNVLASASADTTVKVWDVVTGKCAHTLTHHKGKVQCVAWNPAETPVLLTGAFDRTACLADARTPDGQPLVWTLSADVEALCWAPHQPTSFVVSSEDGIVACFDARGGAGSEPLFRLAAHDKATSTLSFCTAAPGLLATGSTDHRVKLWDVSGNQPALLASEDPKVGAIFSTAFCSDVPHVLAMAGAKGEVGIWDVRSVGGVATKYPQLMKGVKGRRKVKGGPQRMARTHASSEAAADSSEDEE